MIYKKIDISGLPFYNVSEDAAKSFIDWRVSLKKPMTQRAFNLAMKEAVLCGQLGITPDEALDKTQLWGWQSPNYSYTARKMSEEFSAIVSTISKPTNKNVALVDSSIKSTRDISLIEELNDRSWAQ